MISIEGDLLIEYWSHRLGTTILFQYCFCTIFTKWNGKLNHIFALKMTALDRTKASKTTECMDIIHGPIIEISRFVKQYCSRLEYVSRIISIKPSSLSSVDE